MSKLKKRFAVFTTVLAATVCFAGCDTQTSTETEKPEVVVSRIVITGIPGSVGILTVVLDPEYTKPAVRGLAAAGGKVTDTAGIDYEVPEITTGTADMTLHYGADLMGFLLALVGFPPGAVPQMPDVTTAVLIGTGDITVNYSGDLTSMISAAKTRKWYNISFAGIVKNRTLTLDWKDGIDT